MQEKTDKIHRLNAKRIEKTILELKGLFIKMGQMLSIMSNFLPEAFTEELEGLQDAVPPHPYEAIERRFLEEFQKTPQEIFASFNQVPIASASLGQVHMATLKDGTKVAVKIQYPEIDDIVRADIKILRRIFYFLHVLFPSYGLKSVFEEISEVVLQELDYVYEGKNLELLRKNFESEKDFLFPHVYWKFSSSKIITLHFMEGIKISAVDDFKKLGIDPQNIATKIIHGYCKQIFMDGVYHADPHPGNLLVTKEEGGEDRIILVDFGATAKISERMRRGITVFAEGLIKRDTRILANAMREMGFVARQDGFEPFEDLVDYFYEKISNLKIENFKKMDLGQLRNLEDLIELKKMNIHFKDLMTSFHVPKDWILLERTLILVMGLCAHLAPQMNPIEIVLPYVEKFVLKDRTLSEVVVELSKQMVVSYLQLPYEIQKTLRRLNEGTLTLESKRLGQHTEKMYAMGHQFLYGLLGLSGLFLWNYWQERGLESWSSDALYGSIFFGSTLLISIFRNRL